MIRSILLTLFFALSLSTAFAAKTTEFYVVAHQDDWQLFMGLDVYHAMNDTNKKVVIIHTTAGDGSFNAPQVNRKYYMARERGAIASLEFAMDIERYHTREYMDTIVVNGHDIIKFEYKNVIDYFLRLPDGCGSTGLHGQSIEYLQRKIINKISAVDSSATYYGWNDLVKTMRTIMETEADGSQVIGLNTADTNISFNPGDHADHLFTGKLAMIASANMDNMWKRLYIDYHSEKMPINLTPQEIVLKAAIYGVAEYSRSMDASSNSWCQGHIDYLCRTYSRTVSSRIDSFLHTSPNPGEAILYPNPATDAVNIIYHITQPTSVTITITGINGQVVMNPVIFQKDAGDYSTRIDITSLSAGSYIATFQTASSRQTFRFVKQ